MLAFIKSGVFTSNDHFFLVQYLGWMPWPIFKFYLDENQTTDFLKASKHANQCVVMTFNSQCHKLEFLILLSQTYKYERNAQKKSNYV